MNLDQDIVQGRGAALEQESREVIQELEDIDDQRVPPSIAIRIGRVGAEISQWFALVLGLRVVPEDVKAEQKQYFRALFNLSIDKRTRLVMVQHHDVLSTMTRFLQRMRQDDSLSTLMAAVANLVYEDESKDELMKDGNVPALFTRLLGSTNNAVATHTARGIFSLTTVYEFKKRFASEEGLLAALIACLGRDSNQLIMNAAGAIANIAIHPESKVPIVALGALDSLMKLGRDEDDEGVLHQVSRCLFSLAAERTNRPLMCSKGIMDIISRLLNFSRHVEILTNAIGCFGNLAMSEPEASDDSVGTALRLLPILATSTSSAMDRQATRVLLAFVPKDMVRSTMAERGHLRMLVGKLDSSDMTVVRDVLGILSSLVFGDADLKERVCELGGLRRVLDLFMSQPEQHKSDPIPEALPPLIRVLFAIASCPAAREAICAENSGGVLKKLCTLSSRFVQAESNLACNVGAMLKHALGTLACLACEDRHSAVLAEHGAIGCAVEALYTCVRQDVRRQAGRLMYNLVRRHGVALTYLTRWGGRNGESLRLEADLKGLFRDGFELAPLTASDLHESFLVQVPLLVPEQDGPVIHAIRCPVPLVRARAPLFLDRENLHNLPILTRELWTYFFELVCTNSISLTADVQSSRGHAEQWRTLTRFLALSDGPEHELSGVELGSCSASVPLASPVDLDQPMFGSAALGHSTAGYPVSSATNVQPVPMRITVDGEEETREGDCLNGGLNAHLGPTWTECMTTRLLASRNRPPHLPRVLPGELLLRSSATSTATSKRLYTGDEASTPSRLRSRLQRSASKKPRAGVVQESYLNQLLREWSVPPERVHSSRKRMHASHGDDDESEVLIRADRAILAARSRYFKSLLTGPFAESLRSESVFDFRASPVALVAVVRYIHCGMDAHLSAALQKELGVCWEVFSAAHEYGLEGLQYACERIIAMDARASVCPRAGSSLDVALKLARAVQGLNAPFIKLHLAHLAVTDSHPKLEAARNELLDLIAMPHLLSSHAQPVFQRGDSGGIEHSEHDPELDAAARKLSVLGQHRA